MAAVLSQTVRVRAVPQPAEISSPIARRPGRLWASAITAPLRSWKRMFASGLMRT
jgi:hypothetical protein